MNKCRRPELQEIEKLTAFLPRLYAEGFSPIESWSGGEKQKDGSFTLPYPDYNPIVEEFFRLVSSDGWLDYEYRPEQAYQMLNDENLIKTASLPQIKTMLTFYVRGEHFSDGHWGEMIEKGYIRRLLQRLDEIKSELMK
ncbi:MAG TPA: DUF6508 domain-containing protein [Anaerolineales bacterium]|nr:DUF6508 domain-containing protein [Anaerolineales bacterium]